MAGFTDGTIRLFDLTGRLWSPSARSLSGGRGGDSDSEDEDEEEDNIFEQDSDSEDDNEGGPTTSNTVDDEMRDLFDNNSDESDEDDVDPKTSSKRRCSKSSKKSSIPTTTPANTNDTPSASTTGRGRVHSVCSKSNEQYGAVAAQIHAKGVITSLLMDVGIAQDGLYAFGGVLRGSMELIAVDLSKVEAYHDALSAASGGRETRVGSTGSDDMMDGNGGGSAGRIDILDLVSVYRHSDAKLKGFGACTRLRRGGEVEYRLFTGKGIKVRTMEK